MIIFASVLAALQALAPAGEPQTIAFEELQPATYGSPAIALRAEATSGLPVRFTASGDCVAEDGTVRIVAAGNCWVTAHQDGDERFAAAEDVTRRLEIAKAEQSIEFPEIADRVWRDPDFEVPAKTNSRLPLSFETDGSCEVVRSWVRLLGAGVCAITAHQAGDRNYTAAPIVERRFLVARADQAIVFDPIARGAEANVFGVHATADSQLPVFFRIEGACALSGPILTVRPGGWCTVAAWQPGDGNFEPAGDVCQTVSVPAPDQRGYAAITPPRPCTPGSASRRPAGARDTPGRSSSARPGPA